MVPVESAGQGFKSFSPHETPPVPFTCETCAGEHDEAIHAATLAVRAWWRRRVTRYFNRGADPQRPPRRRRHAHCTPLARIADVRISTTKRPEHGTRGRYANYGCRCEACVAAGAAYRHARKSAGSGREQP